MTFAANDSDFLVKLNALASSYYALSTKAGNFTAVAGNWYILTANAITVTLPAGANAFDRIRFSSGSVSVVAATLGNNGLKIDSALANKALTVLVNEGRLEFTSYGGATFIKLPDSNS